MNASVIATTARHAPLATGAAVAAVIAALYFGRDLLIPMALAALLAFALEPLATRLRRLGLGRTGSVLIVVALALSLIGGFGFTIGSQVFKLAEKVPVYKTNIERKIRLLRGTAPSSGVLGKASTALRELSDEIKTPAADAAAPAPAGQVRKTAPVAVTLEQAEPSALQMAQDVLGPVVAPIGVLGLVIVFLVFMLLEQADLRDRMIRLFGGRDLTVTTSAMSEAAQRVSRYLLMQLLVNISYGVPIGIGLYLIGVPNALLWGAMAVVLRFVPYVGPFIAMMFPLVLAVAVDPGWSMLFWTIGLFVALELISNNVVEPLLYGSSTGMSAVAIIAAAMFWTTLWGPAGLLLSTPLTVCLVVLGRYVPQLHFLDVLLGRNPALQPPERFYQRMLAGDVFEGVEIAGAAAAEKGIGGFEQDVALPALQMAEDDRQQNLLTTERAEAVGQATLQALAMLEDFDGPAEKRDDAAGPTGPVVWGQSAVLCMGWRTALDAAAAAILAQSLRRSGIGARSAPPGTLTSATLQEVMTSTPPELTVITFLAGASQAQARQACRKARKFGKPQILLAFFGKSESSHPPAYTALIEDGSCDAIVHAFAEARDWIDKRARLSIDTPMMDAPLVEHEFERLHSLEATGLLDTPPDPVFDAITEKLKEAFDVPIALLSLVDGERQFWKSSSGLPPALCEARESARNTSICGHVVAANDVMVVEDTLRDPRFANNPMLREHGIRFYAGAPLRADNGLAIGTLCVLGLEPRQVSKTERSLLQLAATQVMREIESNSRQPSDLISAT